MRYIYFLILLVCLLALRFGSFWGASYYELGLIPIEAHNWALSKELSFGYFNQPPGIAWEIAGGTYFFGDTELGVRIGSAIAATLSSIALYFLALSIGFEAFFAFLAALTFSVTPLSIFSGLLATTCAPLLLFWILALIPLREDAENLEATGLFIALGALFNWAIYLLLIPLLAVTIIYRRSFLHFIGAVFISLLGLLPSAIWDYLHNFVTYKHIVMGLTSHLSGGAPLSFFLSQCTLISPLIFILLIVSFLTLLFKLRKLPSPICIAWFISLFVFAITFTFACFRKVHMSIASIAYPTAVLVLIAWAKIGRPIKRVFLYLSIILSLLMVGYAPSLSSQMEYKKNIFRKALGWQRISKGLVDIGYNPNEQLLLADTKSLASLLSFYGPEQKPVQALSPTLEMNKTCFYVFLLEGDNVADTIYAAHKEMQKQLAPYFTTISPTVFAIPLYKEQKLALVIRAEGYKGALQP